MITHSCGQTFKYSDHGHECHGKFGLFFDILDFFELYFFKVSMLPAHELKSLIGAQVHSKKKESLMVLSLYPQFMEESMFQCK